MPLGITYPTGSRPSGDEARALVREALACGARLFDTADAYCGGPGEEHYVERMLSEAVLAAGRSDGVVLATKCGMRRTGPTSRGWAPANYSPAQLETAIRNSHRALGLGQRPVALWQMHHCDGYSVDAASSSSGEFRSLLSAVKGLVAEGLIERVGLCNCSVRHAEIALEMGLPLVSVQNHYSLWDRVAEKKPPDGSKCGKGSKTGVLAFCQAHGLAFLAHGALGGVRARDDRVDLARDFPTVAEMASRKGVSAQALVLAWMRHRWPCIMHIPGARKLEHVRDSVLTPATVRFTEAEFRLIDGLRAARR